MILLIDDGRFVRRNAICGGGQADAGCLTEKACATHGDPPGLRATVKLWRGSRAPAVPRASVPRRFPLNNSRLSSAGQEPFIPFTRQCCTHDFSLLVFIQISFRRILEGWPEGLSPSLTNGGNLRSFKRRKEIKSHIFLVKDNIWDDIIKGWTTSSSWKWVFVSFNHHSPTTTKAPYLKTLLSHKRWKCFSKNLFPFWKYLLGRSFFPGGRILPFWGGPNFRSLANTWRQ